MDGIAESGTVDTEETELASRLRLAVTRLHRRLRQQAAGGLTQTQASALASIGQLGSPTLGALAARESVQPPSMTRIVGALEELGHVSRVIDPADRRVARVTLTAQGHEVLQRSRSLKNAYLAQQLHRLPPDERQALGNLTVLLERLVTLDES
jgi:DNA-binding MarR family transcriptional regulator